MRIPLGGHQVLIVVAIGGAAVLGCTNGEVLVQRIEFDVNGNEVARGPEKNGQKCGYWVTPSLSGNVLLLRGYRNGKPHGKWLEWDADGTLVSDVEYREGKPWDGTFVEPGGVALAPDNLTHVLLEQVRYKYQKGLIVSNTIEYSLPMPPSEGSYRDGQPWQGTIITKVSDEKDAEELQAGFFISEYANGRQVTTSDE